MICEMSEVRPDEATSQNFEIIPEHFIPFKGRQEQSISKVHFLNTS